MLFWLFAALLVLILATRNVMALKVCHQLLVLTGLLNQPRNVND